jgi:hypothetical protein
VALRDPAGIRRLGPQVPPDRAQDQAHVGQPGNALHHRLSPAHHPIRDLGHPRVDSTGSLKTLLEKKLIKIIGHESAGNPLIYRTSDRFLQYFGLNSLDDLPKEEEIAKLLQEDKSTEA